MLFYSLWIIYYFLYFSAFSLFSLVHRLTKHAHKVIIDLAIVRLSLDFTTLALFLPVALWRVAVSYSCQIGNAFLDISKLVWIIRSFRYPRLIPASRSYPFLLFVESLL